MKCIDSPEFGKVFIKFDSQEMLPSSRTFLEFFNQNGRKILKRVGTLAGMLTRVFSCTVILMLKISYLVVAETDRGIFIAGASQAVLPSYTAIFL
jgi:hypothetical protein